MVAEKWTLHCKIAFTVTHDYLEDRKVISVHWRRCCRFSFDNKVKEAMFTWLWEQRKNFSVGNTAASWTIQQMHCLVLGLCGKVIFSIAHGFLLLKLLNILSLYFFYFLCMCVFIYSHQKYIMKAYFCIFYIFYATFGIFIFSLCVMALTKSCGEHLRKKICLNGSPCALRWRKPRNTGCATANRRTSSHFVMAHINSLIFRLP